jgi:hypothetical protein
MPLISLDYLLKERRIRDAVTLENPLGLYNFIEITQTEGYEEYKRICEKSKEKIAKEDMRDLFNNDDEATDILTSIKQKYKANEVAAKNLIVYTSGGPFANGLKMLEHTEIPKREAEIESKYFELIFLLLSDARLSEHTVGVLSGYSKRVYDITFDELLNADTQIIEAYKTSGKTLSGMEWNEAAHNFERFEKKIEDVKKFLEGISLDEENHAAYLFGEKQFAELVKEYLKYRSDVLSGLNKSLEKMLSTDLSNYTYISHAFYEKTIEMLPKGSHAMEEITREYLFSELKIGTKSELFEHLYHELNKEKLDVDRLIGTLILAINTFPDMACKFRPLIATAIKLETNKSGKSPIDNFKKEFASLEKDIDEKNTLKPFNYKHLSNEEKQLGVILADELSISTGNFSDVNIEFIETFYKNVADYLHVERPDNPIVERSAQQVSERIHREVNKATAKNDAVSLEKLLELNEKVLEFSKTKSHPDTATEKKLVEAGVDKFRALKTVYREPSLEVFKRVKKECIDNLEKIGICYIKKGKVTEGKKCFDIGERKSHETVFSKENWEKLANALFICDRIDDAIIAYKAAGVSIAFGLLERNTELYKSGHDPKSKEFHFNPDETKESDKDNFECDCPECGSKVKGKSTICPECGAEFE